MTEIEQADMSEVDRFLVEYIRRYHSHCDHVPRRPEGFPLCERGGGERARRNDTVGRFEERERKRRSLKKP